MKASIRIAVLALAALAAAAGARPGAAQSDILLRLRSGSPLGDRVRVDSAGGFVAMGELGIGIIPASGAGYRMMWYPFKAAFRAGGTDDGGAGSYWDDANVGFYSWAGGNLTTASAFATFAFGDHVTVSGVYGAGFGASNSVTGTGGFTAGASNICANSYCVALGFDNNASGLYSVAVGYKATADANYSVALGHRASTNGHAGSFVISDFSTTDSTEASAANQFTSRYAGGYRLYTNPSETAGVYLNAGTGSWNAFSDANHKEAILPVDRDDVLDRIRSLPLSTWRYIGEADRSARHIGPMAQDWQRAFGFSGDSTTINMSDFDGVNLAGIQALERRTARQASEIETLAADNTALRAQVETLRMQNEMLEERLRRLEALVVPPQPSPVP